MYFYTKEQKAVNAQTGEKEVSCITSAYETMELAEEQLYYDAWYAINQKDTFDFYIGAITNELGNTEKLIRKDWRVPVIPENPTNEDENEESEETSEPEEEGQEG